VCCCFRIECGCNCVAVLGQTGYGDARSFLLCDSQWFQGRCYNLAFCNAPMLLLCICWESNIVACMKLLLVYTSNLECGFCLIYGSFVLQVSCCVAVMDYKCLVMLASLVSKVAVLTIFLGCIFWVYVFILCVNLVVMAYNHAFVVCPSSYPIAISWCNCGLYLYCSSVSTFGSECDVSIDFVATRSLLLCANSCFHVNVW
jgi:hypothetical protein